MLLLVSSLFPELTATTVDCSSSSGLGNVHSAQINYNQDPLNLERERERDRVDSWWNTAHTDIRLARARSTK